MLISAKLIQKPRKLRFCETCKEHIIGPQLRLYGSGCHTDPKYTIYIHPNCATELDNPKIQRALIPNPRKEEP
jgi:hypothetical protein